MTFTAPRLATKSQTLDSLRGHVERSIILPQFNLTCAQWMADRGTVLREIARTLDVGAGLIARSSAQVEDRAGASLAGAFVSVPDIDTSDALDAAIDAVISSYGPAPDPQDEVLIQAMLKGVILSGVAFTHDPTSGAPYRVITIHRGEDTSVVTAGQKGSETFVGLAGAENIPDDLASVFALLAELEGIFPDTPLDIEFAVCAGTHAGLVLLQARPLAMADGIATMGTEDHNRLVSRIADKIASGMQAHPFLAGRSTVYGVMPDWNPAEIIGRRPRPLSLSLYRNLVTDTTWAYQRDNYGYRNLRGFPLIQSLAGHPFIDVRLSFNSFIPGDLDDALAHRLVDYYIDRLTHTPALHDKVEFEIVFSCYSLDLPQRLEALKEAGFSEAECDALAVGLRKLTNSVVKPEEGLWRLDAQKIEILRERRLDIVSSDLPPFSRIYWLLEDCRRYGTLPFAGLARAGFIAVQMLRSLVTTGIFSEADYHDFMQSVDTVSRQFTRDLAHKDRTSFLSLYGHLRPGTYDITSPRYDDAPDMYLSGRDRAHDDSETVRKPFGLTLEQMKKIRALLREHDLKIDVLELMEFLQAGIEMREYSKFVFSRNLSDALAILTDWGQQHGLSTDDLSFMDIGLISELHASTEDPVEMISASIAVGREKYANACRVCLPPLITSPRDAFAFTVREAEPNFITRNSVTGPVVSLQAGAEGHGDLAGAIVFISSADPGFDWLFAHNIGGLVTAYGGSNSHMAIRAGELGLPAIIGAGDLLFEGWAKSKRLRLDCAAQLVEHIA
jgi:phosphohistidine swiveling domain-containing protein